MRKLGDPGTRENTRNDNARRTGLDHCPEWPWDRLEIYPTVKALLAGGPYSITPAIAAFSKVATKPTNNARPPSRARS
jgi:hypothetical protein